MYNYVRILGLLFSFPDTSFSKKVSPKTKLGLRVPQPPTPLKKIMTLLLTFILPNLTFNVYKSQKHVAIRPLISIDISILKKYQVNQN